MKILRTSQLPTCFGYDIDAIELTFEIKKKKKGKFLTICEMFYIHRCLSLIAFDNSLIKLPTQRFRMDNTYI